MQNASIEGEQPREIAALQRIVCTLPDEGLGPSKPYPRSGGSVKGKLEVLAGDLQCDS